MIKKGWSHLGLGTRDLDGTKKFYEEILGFETVRFDRFDVAEGGYIRHLFLDVGNGQMISFMEPNGVSGLPDDFDAGINGGLGLPNAFYHLAFEAGSVEGLEQMRAHLESHGIEVSPVTDHDWCRSIYFYDPVNRLSLEYSTLSREFTEDDRTYQYRFTGAQALLDVSIDALKAAEAHRHEELEARS